MNPFSHTGWRYTAVAVMDGSLNSRNLLGKICNGTRRIFTSPDNRMIFRFPSDVGVQNTGYSAWYNSFARGECKLDMSFEAQCIFTAPSSACIVVPTGNPRRVSAMCCPFSLSLTVTVVSQGSQVWRIGETPGLGLATNSLGDLLTLLAEPTPPLEAGGV